MIRLAVGLVALVLLCASPATAQWDDAPSSSSSTAFALAAPAMAPTPSAATSEHRAGVGLIATGLMADVGGGIGAFFSLVGSLSGGGGSCSPRCPPRDQTDWPSLFVTSIAVSGVGLVLFFVGLGLDIHAHVLRGQAGQIRLSGNGLSVSF